MIAHVRLAAAATAVCGVILGIAQVTPDPDAADVAVMMPTGEAVLRALGPAEALPTVPPEPDQPTEPRQVAGPVPLPVPAVAAAAPAAAAATSVALVQASSRGIPGSVLAAYQRAARTMTVERPGCHLTWPILAGIGRIESGHARNGDVDAAGTTRTPIVGPALDGAGPFALIRDSDDGVWDGDKTYDRAVGPMQFLPGTWRTAGRDANGDGQANPNNVVDAALASASYLCSGGGDLFVRDHLLAAVFRYNRSWDYVSTVLTWAGLYATQGPLVTAGVPAKTKKKKATVVVAAPRSEAVTESSPSPGPSTEGPQPTSPAAPATTAPATSIPTPSTPAAASIAGRVLDEALRPVQGAPVTVTGPVRATAYSAADGAFTVADLPPGEYQVSAGAAQGYAAPTTAPVTLTLTPGRRKTNLTLSQVTSTLTGRVFVDADSNGRDDPEEDGAPGASVRLTGTDVRGRAVDLTVPTDPTGAFTFTALVAGTYALAAPVLLDPVAALLAIAPLGLGELHSDGGVGAIPVGVGVGLAGFGFALNQVVPVL